MSDGPRDDHAPDEAGADDEQREKRRRHDVDPDAPGNFVDDRESDEVPEPNEPA